MEWETYIKEQEKTEEGSLYWQILLDFWGATDLASLKKNVFKYTDCGAWVDVNEQGATFGSIVEGSDAEVPPIRIKWEDISKETIRKAIEEIEETANFLWEDANGTEK